VARVRIERSPCVEPLSGRSIRYAQVPMEEYVIALEQAQLPQEFIALIKYLFTEVLDGRNAFVSDGVQRARPRSA
jgi:hypothetical protein